MELQVLLTVVGKEDEQPISGIWPGRVLVSILEAFGLIAEERVARGYGQL